MPAMALLVPKSMRSLAALATLAALACATPQVDVTYEEDADFSALKTYAWYPRTTQVEGDRAAALPPDFPEVVRPKIESTLREKGYAKVAPRSADFLVLYHLSLERKIDTEMLAGALSGSEWEIHRPTEHTIEYDEGTLIIDVLDTHSHRLVWRGRARRNLHREARPHEVEESVSKVLARFPPGS